MAPSRNLFNGPNAAPSMLLGSLLLLLCSSVAFSQSIVKTLPGFSGTLPFKLETGYIGVGDADEVQLFYYFFESERDPVTDSLMLWLTGGPGCSGLSAIAFETGPFHFDTAAFNGSKTSIKLKVNPHAWTKVSSVIYIDAPVETGYSYATTAKGAYSSDSIQAGHLYTFLRKWLISHPQFAYNPLYIGGDSYSGFTVPLLLTKILKGLDEGLQPTMQLQGYVLGNPKTDTYLDNNSRVKFAHRVSIIPDDLYEDAKLYCYGDYVNVDPNNTLCVIALQQIKECLLQINLCNILEPQCAFSSKPKELNWDLRAHEAGIIESILSKNGPLPELKCREHGYVLSYIWANDKEVQKALYVRPGTVENWSRCSKNFSTFTSELDSVIAYHKNFSETTGLRALIYSGDHDVSIPYVATQQWITSLGVSTFDQWRPWYHDGQIAGYQQKFMNSHYRLTYVTVKGAGHTAPEYKPAPCLSMIDRFFSYYPI